MTAVAIRPEELKKNIAAALGAKARQVTLALDEVTVTVAAADYLESMRILRDADACKFEQLIDLCGVDYSTYADAVQEGPRYAVVSHLLSVSLNQRVRVGWSHGTLGRFCEELRPFFICKAKIGRAQLAKVAACAYTPRERGIMAAREH